METNYELDLRFFREKKQKSSRKRAVEPKTQKGFKAMKFITPFKVRLFAKSM